MSKSLMKLSAAAFALCIALPVQAQEESQGDTALGVDSVVATVNGKEITVGHMLMIRAGLPEQYQQMPTDALWDGIMTQIVQQEVLAQSDGAEETRRVRVALENEERTLLAGEAITKVAEGAATDEAVQDAYQAQYVEGDLGQEFNASHILVETEEEAQAIVEELESGADFAETAKEKSTGPSGPNGGSLGWFSAGMMVEAFQQAVEELEAGGVSEPVQTQFGWHVITLNETRSKEAPALEEVRGQIVQKLQQEAVQAHIDSLIESADVSRQDAEAVDTSILSQIDLLEQ